jgi:hypothetical protein
MFVLDFKLGDVSDILFWKGLIRAGGQHALREMLFLFLLL